MLSLECNIQFRKLACRPDGATQFCLVPVGRVPVAALSQQCAPCPILLLADSGDLLTLGARRDSGCRRVHVGVGWCSCLGDGPRRRGRDAGTLAVPAGWASKDSRAVTPAVPVGPRCLSRLSVRLFAFAFGL
jgi:hypothetical protein